MPRTSFAAVEIILSRFRTLRYRDHYAYKAQIHEDEKI
jgi:hypothetical protein